MFLCAVSLHSEYLEIPWPGLACSEIFFLCNQPNIRSPSRPLCGLHWPLDKFISDREISTVQWIMVIKFRRRITAKVYMWSPLKPWKLHLYIFIFLKWGLLTTHLFVQWRTFPPLTKATKPMKRACSPLVKTNTIHPCQKALLWTTTCIPAQV